MINLSKDIQHIPAPAGIGDYQMQLTTHQVFKSGGGVIYLQPYSVFILKKTN